MSSREDRINALLGIGPAEQPSPRDQDKRRMEMQGYLTMLPFLSLHDGSKGRVMAVLVKGAQLFLITFAFVMPVVLLIAYG